MIIIPSDTIANADVYFHISQVYYARLSYYSNEVDYESRQMDNSVVENKTIKIIYEYTRTIR